MTNDVCDNDAEPVIRLVLNSAPGLISAITTPGSAKSFATVFGLTYLIGFVPKKNPHALLIILSPLMNYTTFNIFRQTLALNTFFWYNMQAREVDIME